jgi:predicted secreted hydrolase
MFLLGRFLALFLMMVVSSQLAAEDFTRASHGYQWSFPQDHGQHSSYESEWWYYTGQLYEQGQTPFRDKPRLGFQLTFFRKAGQASRSVNNDYMAHAAVTDLVAGKTLFESRLGGGALGLAGVAQGSLRSWSGDWSVDSIGDSLFLRFSVADGENHSVRQLRIHVSQTPPPWLQGIGGLSAKSDCAGCASMYYTLPRMSVTAQYIHGDREQALSGIAWMDHEFMTNSLSSSQSGWDWMGLMLKDGRSVMLFRVRSKDTSTGEYIAGGIRRAEDSRLLTKGDFKLTPVTSWTSPRSRATYPVAWRVQIPSESIDVTVSARTHDCEVGMSERGATQPTKGRGITYWEGPVASGDESALGYLEMTGYAGELSLD